MVFVTILLPCLRGLTIPLQTDELLSPSSQLQVRPTIYPGLMSRQQWGQNLSLFIHMFKTHPSFWPTTPTRVFVYNKNNIKIILVFKLSCLHVFVASGMTGTRQMLWWKWMPMVPSLIFNYIIGEYRPIQNSCHKKNISCTVSITIFYVGLWHEMYMLWLYQWHWHLSGNITPLIIWEQIGNFVYI